MPKEERAIAVRRKDWDRIRRRLESVKGQRKEFSSAAWAFVGIAVSAIFAGIAWDPAYRTMAAPARPDAAWVWPTLINIGIAATIIAAATFWFSRQSKASEAASIEEILEDMDEIAGAPQSDL